MVNEMTNTVTSTAVIQFEFGLNVVIALFILVSSICHCPADFYYDVLFRVLVATVIDKRSMFFLIHYSCQFLLGDVTY